MLGCPNDFHEENRSFSAFKKKRVTDRRTDGPSNGPTDRRTIRRTRPHIEMQFYLSVIFLGFPDKIHEEKPSFLDFENNWLRTDGRTDPLIEMRGRI